jgi:sugar phosphate isomerase/epimerase
MDAIATLGRRIASIHVHDNHGVKDEHLWPGDGSIDWKSAIPALQALATPPGIVLEISHSLSAKPDELPASIEKAFSLFDQNS